jgi:hypothetical protein
LIWIVDKVSELDNPILEIQSHYDGCTVSFILRGNTVEEHYEAMGKLSAAAIQAQHLITNLRVQDKAAVLLVYEFDKESNRWYPSFAELSDGTLVTDNKKLIAEQELPTGLSLGLLSKRI